MNFKTFIVTFHLIYFFINYPYCKRKTRFDKQLKNQFSTQNPPRRKKHIISSFPLIRSFHFLNVQRKTFFLLAKSQPVVNNTQLDYVFQSNCVSSVNKCFLSGAIFCASSVNIESGRIDLGPIPDIPSENGEYS